MGETRDSQGTSVAERPATPITVRAPGAFIRPNRPNHPVTEMTLSTFEQVNTHARWIIRHYLHWLGLHFSTRTPVAPSERRRVIEALFHEGARMPAFLRRFASLMALSVTIAALGVLSDSTAVVIGAMLVAPLLTPVLGVAASIVMGWPRRVFRQTIVVSLGAVGSVGLAALTSWMIPGDPLPLPSELLARTAPNLLDLGIALAAGAAGAYGQVRRQASDALPGVAVAVALVPPLAVVGVALQLGDLAYAAGAGLLFLTNVAGIVFAASVTFVVSGFVPGRRLLAGSPTIAAGLRTAAVVVMVLVVPVQMTRGQLLPPVDHTAVVTAAIDDYLEGEAELIEVMGVTVRAFNDVAEVDLVLATPIEPPSADDLAEFLASELDKPVELQMMAVATDDTRARSTGPPEPGDG